MKIKLHFQLSPYKFPFFISSSFFTNRAKSPKLTTTAAKYPTIIENTAKKAPKDPRPSKPPERSPLENIFPTSERRLPPTFAQIVIINKIITT